MVVEGVGGVCTGHGHRRHIIQPFLKMCIFFARKLQKPLHTYTYPTIYNDYQRLTNGGVIIKVVGVGGVWWGGHTKSMSKGNPRRLVKNVGAHPRFTPFFVRYRK